MFNRIPSTIVQDQHLPLTRVYTCICECGHQSISMVQSMHFADAPILMTVHYTQCTECESADLPF